MFKCNESLGENQKHEENVRRSVQKAQAFSRRPTIGKCRLEFRHSIFSDEVTFVPSTV